MSLHPFSLFFLLDNWWMSKFTWTPQSWQSVWNSNCIEQESVSEFLSWVLAIQMEESQDEEYSWDTAVQENYRLDSDNDINSEPYASISRSNTESILGETEVAICVLDLLECIQMCSSPWYCQQFHVWNQTGDGYWVHTSFHKETWEDRVHKGQRWSLWARPTWGIRWWRKL